MAFNITVYTNNPLGRINFVAKATFKADTREEAVELASDLFKKTYPGNKVNYFHSEAT